MCYCDPSIRTPNCGRYGCHPGHPNYPYLIETITTDKTPPALNLKMTVKPILAESMNEVSDNVVEYLNKAIQANWDGKKAKVMIGVTEKSIGAKINYRKIKELFADYGWCVDYNKNIVINDDEWLIFTVRK